MKKLLVLGVVLTLIAAVTAWFVDRGGILPTKEIRYRFEVTVETPNGTMTGYSVHRLVIQDQTGTPSRTYHTDLDGEAVPFELPDGRILFATLRGKGDVGLLQVFGATVGLPSSGRWIDAPEHFDALVRANNSPTLAIIDSPDDVESLRWVHDYAEFRVVGARLMSTNEKMTERVADLLPWLVAFIKNAPYSSREMTDTNIIAFNLKTGVRG